MNGDQLYEDHRQLGVLFDDLLTRAEAHQWWLCDEIWDELTKRLEGHMMFEERELFPSLARTRPGVEPIVAKLLREHDELRAMAFRIGVELQFHRLDTDAVGALVARLRAHAEEENATVYPQSATSGIPAPSRAAPVEGTCQPRDR